MITKQPFTLFVETNQLLDAKEGPYFTTAKACELVPRQYRQFGQTVKIFDGSTVVEYWWKSGLEDADLVLKTIGEKYIGTATVQDIVMDSGAIGDTTSHLTVLDGITPVSDFIYEGAYFQIDSFSTIYQVVSIDTPSATDSNITITPALTDDPGGNKLNIFSSYGMVNSLIIGNNLTLSLNNGVALIEATGGGGGSGTVTSVNTTGLISGGPITTSGTITTSMATNKLVGRSTSGTGIMEEISIGSGLTLSAGTLTNTATPTPSGYYGAWQDNITQTAAASNTGYPMIFRTTDLSNGVSVVTNGTNLTRITFDNTGIYNIQFSSQFQNTDTQLQDVTIWLRKNGSDVTGSSGFISVPNAHGGTPGHNICSWNYLLDVVAGEYYEIVWSTSDHAKVTMQYYAAGSPPPSTASVIVTVTQQSGIMAGTGITAINSLTGSAQTITTGTSGTDVAIASSGTTHTLNIPTASSTKRGVVSSTDWSTFNSKQNSITGAASTITTTDLTASRALVSDSSGKVAVSSVTSTTLGYLDATSSIQTQLNTKATDTAVVHNTGTETVAGAKTFSSLITASNGATVTAPTGSGADKVGVIVSGSNTNGGTNYLDFFKAINSAAGATNINKYFRLNSTGAIEIVNSAYTGVILTLTDTGTLNGATQAEMGYLSGVTSAIQTQINALPRVVYTNYTAETTTSTSTTNALTTFTLTISDSNWPLGGVLRLNGLMERTAGSGSIFMGVSINSSQARYFSAAGQNMQWEWQIMKEAANTLRIGMGPSNTGNGAYAVHNTSTTTATASGGNYVFTFYMFVGTSGATSSMRWMKGLMIP